MELLRRLTTDTISQSNHGIIHTEKADYYGTETEECEHRYKTNGKGVR